MARLAGATQAAGAAEASIERAGQWFAWKWVALAAGATVGTLLSAFLALKLIERSHWNALATRQESLLQNIAQLQTTADALEKRSYGLRIVTGSDGAFLVVPKGTQITQCKAGPCIRLD